VAPWVHASFSADRSRILVDMPENDLILNKIFRK
jgi:hypothetical protein